MLRSLNTGIAGLRAHQTMLDVTGNNIANVNTTGFKASSTQFQDTLSQLTQAGAAPDQQVGGTNPAQVGLGVQVAGISTNFAQGSTQVTGRATDMAISGDGFFVVNKGGNTFFTRAGAFDFDSNGNLVTPDGAIVQGWPAVGGVVNAGGPVQNIGLPGAATTAAQATTGVTLGGNLPSDAAPGTEVVRDVEVFDALGESVTLTLAFTKAATGNSWNVQGSDSTGATGNTTLTFANGGYSGGAINVGGVTVDLADLTGYADLSTLKVTDKDGRQAGTLTSFSIGPDGTLVGSFSNGVREPIGQVALATFDNPGGLEKSGNSLYAATVASGGAMVGEAGTDGLGTLVGGALEMSNVDLSQEFTNLIVAQRGFQANSRVITTSDEVLNELVNLKR
ncbi:flagellar hook protein FlgE [Georgenia sp. AZ-5]|uniref:flagellar hook protein FlgE n=1 Tax=Georgenia sp. AZ-5 TaxID=3367526 RepID=UPI003755169B